jgi:OOP family OmpA-OmpF porin
MRKLSCLLLVLASIAAQAGDIAGSKDHPMISRYEGSEILKYETKAFDSVELLSGKVTKYNHTRVAENDEAYAKVEGKYTRIAYAAPPGRSAVEVFRNYEQALTAAGFQIHFSCARTECDKKDKGRAFNLAAAPRDLFSKMVSQHEDQHYLLGKLARDTGDVHASLYVTAATHVGGADKDRVFTNLIVVETQAMQGSMVKVDAAAMSKGLDAEGHIALYEVYFDTNKDALKPESDAALAEIGKLLKDKGSLKVLIVGHTDNAGDLAYNQGLSERRAKAVVDALATKHGIARDRLTAVGAGMAAPVASNDSEAGRAKNRRVELVKR